MAIQNASLGFEELLAKSQVFVELMRIYLRCTPRIQEAILNMIELIDDLEASEEDRERAVGTIAGALLAFAEEGGNNRSAPRFLPPIPQETRKRLFQLQLECGQRLQALRTARGWTQAELAQETGVGQSAISTIETGKCRPQLATLNKLAKALGVANSELWPSQRERCGNPVQPVNGRPSAKDPQPADNQQLRG